MTPDGLTNPGDTLTMATILFFLVDILKHTFRIQGDANKVRGFALVVSLLISIGDAFFGKDAPPIRSIELESVFPIIWAALIRAVLMAATAFGANAVRSSYESDQLAKDGSSPLAPVQKALDTAQEATAGLNATLAVAEKGTQVAAKVFDAAGGFEEQARRIREQAEEQIRSLTPNT
jgi:hypothetical protein